MYYRLAASAKTEKNRTQPVLAVSACQHLIILNLIILLIVEPLGIRGKLSKLEVIVFGATFFALVFYNAKYYVPKYEEFEKRWGHESKTKKISAKILIYLFMALCWGLMILNAWIFHRFK